ncbi:MAG: hypothetical protein M3396_05565 [Actinomycetota bacterium]|nr:hypothetical protein [Actinomycetota bacterium]MDQ3574623.1 hypothetical protein [Actinomycetota bacterium]
MRKLIVALSVAGLMLAGVGPAMAHRPDRNAKAERMCEKEDGTFIDLDGVAYACVLPHAASERDIRQAARQCEKQDGLLFVAVGNLAYACVLPGFEGPVEFDDGHGGHWILDLHGLRITPVVVA